MKRVLIFSTAYLPFVGGAEIAVKEITDRLGADYEFVMVTARLRADVPLKESIGSIDVHRIGRGSWKDKFLLAWRGAAYARALGKFDIVWGIMASYGGVAALRYKKAHPSTKFLLTLQEGDSRAHIYARAWWWWPYFMQIFKRADRIQAISAYLADWARRMGTLAERIQVVPNGVDTVRFNSPDRVILLKARKDMRVKLGMPHDAHLVISVSRLVPKNGIADLIRAMKFLPEDVHLAVVGTGALWSRLSALADTLGIKHRVHFVGFVEHAHLPEYLWASDVFCRPSLSEGLGNVFLEAMVAGVPIVGTRTGGIKDFLIDGETGFACESRNPEDIARTVHRALNDESSRAQAIAHARVMMNERYDWQHISIQMKYLFDTLCAFS